MTCQTMRWLCSALVGADGWLAVGSDKPSSSLPSSPEEEDDESNKSGDNGPWFNIEATLPIRWI